MKTNRYFHYTNEWFTWKYATRKLHTYTKLHMGILWRIFQILTSENTSISLDLHKFFKIEKSFLRTFLTNSKDLQRFPRTFRKIFKTCQKLSESSLTTFEDFRFFVFYQLK